MNVGEVRFSTGQSPFSAHAFDLLCIRPIKTTTQFMIMISTTY